MSFRPNLDPWLHKMLVVTASIGLLITTATVVVNVVGRSLLSSPLLGAVEIVGMAGVLIVPFAMALTEQSRAHIVVKMVVSNLPDRFRSFLSLVTNLLSLLVAIILVWAGALQFWQAVVTPGFETQALRIPKPPFVIVWMCGCLFLFGLLLKHFLAELMGRRKK